MDLGIKKKFMVRLMVLWNRLAREVVGACHWKHSKIRLNEALSNLTS